MTLDDLIDFLEKIKARDKNNGNLKVLLEQEDTEGDISQFAIDDSLENKFTRTQWIDGKSKQMIIIPIIYKEF